MIALQAAGRPTSAARAASTLRLVLIGLTLAATPALADDKTACAEGIAMIRDALAKAPPDAVAAKLKTSLRVAEREQGEAEYDECLDAVGDARRALGR